MTRYWFNLDPGTFLWKSNEKVLLYNTSVQKSLTFETNIDLNNIVGQLKDIDNLYCIELAKSEIHSKALSTFIKSTVSSGFGNVIKAEEGVKKPAFFVPVLKLQNNMRKVDHFVKENDNMLPYLHELDIYVNEGENVGLNSFASSTKTTNISYPDLLYFLRTFINCSFINTINICGNNLLKYSSIRLLIDELDKTKIAKIFHLNPEHLLDKMEELILWKSKPDQINLIVEEGFGLEKISSVKQIIKSLGINTVWKFKISSEQAYEEVENVIELHEIESYEIKPFFNSSNQDFFEKFIYLTEEDIQNSQLTKREIFAHQVLNTNDFGKISVKADGAVYANLYQPPLGTINDPINEMLYKELNSHSSWLRIRDTAPCTNCIYKWLCPSPSNYEFELGKFNLCHVIA